MQERERERDASIWSTSSIYICSDLNHEWRERAPVLYCSHLVVHAVSAAAGVFHGGDCRALLISEWRIHLTLYTPLVRWWPWDVSTNQSNTTEVYRLGNKVTTCFLVMIDICRRSGRPSPTSQNKTSIHAYQYTYMYVLLAVCTFLSGVVVNKVVYYYRRLSIILPVVQY